MATNTNKKSTSTPANDSVATNEADTQSAESVKSQKKIVAKDVDVNQLIPVRNGFQGKLIYQSARTSERYVWEEFGEEQEIELRELRNAKSSAKTFFINNWFVFDDDYLWVIDYLGVGKFYENALDVEHFDEIYSLSPEKIKYVVSKLSDGQKQSVAYRARVLIADGAIDSNKAITALEESLGVELIER